MADNRYKKVHRVVTTNLPSSLGLLEIDSQDFGAINWKIFDPQKQTHAHIDEFHYGY